MIFAINVDISKFSDIFLEKTLSKFSFCDNLTFYCFFICESEEQKGEEKEIKKRLSKIFSKYNIKYKLFIETGDILSRTLFLINKVKPNFFIAHYEHSILGNTFFENLIKETNIPLIVLN
jgi:hypothetical protein